MDTAATVHELLKNGVAAGEAAELVKSGNPHSLMAKLRDLYQRIYGRVALDIHDWHWQATALKNHIAANGAPTAKSQTAPVADQTVVPPTSPSDPHSKGLLDAPVSQGTDEPVSTAAPGMPTSTGTPTEIGKPASIKPTPDATDPTDASLIKTAPDVTDPVAGGVTATPGSPAAEVAPPASHAIHAPGTADAP